MIYPEELFLSGFVDVGQKQVNCVAIQLEKTIYYRGSQSNTWQYSLSIQCRVNRPASPASGHRGWLQNTDRCDRL